MKKRYNEIESHEAVSFDQLFRSYLCVLGDASHVSDQLDEAYNDDIDAEMQREANRVDNIWQRFT